MSRDPVYGQLENTIANWTEEVTQAHNQLTSQIAEARDQLDTLSTIMAKRQGESSALSKSREDIARLKESVRKRDAELQQVQLERDTLERRNSLAEQQKVQAEERIALLRREKEDLDRSLGESRSVSREALGRVSTLEIELAACRDTLEEQRRDAESDKTRIASLNERVSQLQEELSALTHRALASEQETGKLLTRLGTAESDVAGTRADLNLKENELQQLSQVLADREAHVESAQQQIMENQREIGCLQIEIECIRESRDALAQEAGLLKEEKATFDDRISQLAQQASDMGQENEQLGQTLAGLREALSESSRLLDETSQALRELQQEHESLKGDYEQCQAELEEASRTAMQRQEDYQELQDAHAQVQTALASYRETLEKLKQERTALASELEARDAALAESRERGELLRGENARLEIVRAELEANLVSNSEALRSESERFEATLSLLNDIRASLADTESRLNALRFREHELTTRLDESSREIYARDTIILDLRTVLGERDESITCLEDELFSTRELLWNTSAEGGALQDRVGELEDQLNCQSMTLRETNESLAKNREKLAVIEAAYAETTKSLEAAEGSIAHLQQEVSAAQVRERDLSAELTALESAHVEATRALEAAEQAKAELGDALTQSEARGREVSCELSSVQSAKAELARALESSERVNAELGDGLTRSEARERALSQDLLAIRTEREQMGVALAEATDGLEQRCQELVRLSEDREALQQRHDNLLEERNLLSNKVAAMEEAEKALEQDLRNRLALLKTMEAELEAGRQRHAQLEEMLGSERAHHTASLIAAREEQQSLMRAIDEEQTASSQLQASILEHEAAAAASERRIHQAESSIATLNERARELEERFSEELRQARSRHEETETMLKQREHELTQRTAVIKQREGELDAANRTLTRLEQSLDAQKEQFESVRTGLECDIDAANNRVRATEAALQGTRAENMALANVLKEKEDLIGREQRARQQMDSAHRTMTQDLETARKRVSIAEAENESLTTQLENATIREKETARDLSLAQAAIRTLQETIQQKENAVQQEKIRTAQLLHQTVSALQSELTQINTVDGQRAPSSKWMSALNLDGTLAGDDMQRELPFSGEGNGSTNGNGAHYGAGRSGK